MSHVIIKDAVFSGNISPSFSSCNHAFQCHLVALLLCLSHGKYISSVPSPFMMEVGQGSQTWPTGNL